MRQPILMMVAFLAAVASCMAHAADEPKAKPKAATSTRTEHDLLGDKQVPADAYYGVQTARALENFQISDVSMATTRSSSKASRS